MNFHDCAIAAFWVYCFPEMRYFLFSTLSAQLTHFWYTWRWCHAPVERLMWQELRLCHIICETINLFNYQLLNVWRATQSGYFYCLFCMKTKVLLSTDDLRIFVFWKSWFARRFAFRTPSAVLKTLANTLGELLRRFVTLQSSEHFSSHLTRLVLCCEIEFLIEYSYAHYIDSSSDKKKQASPTSNDH